MFKFFKVKAATLLLLGGVDLRVPPSQGKEFYKTLRCRGVETKYGAFNVRYF